MSLSVTLSTAGCPLVSASGLSGQLLRDGEPVATLDGREVLLADPFAPSGRPTSYRVGSAQQRVTSRLPQGVVSHGGCFVPCSVLDRQDPRELALGVKTYSLSDGWNAFRRPLRQGATGVAVHLMCLHTQLGELQEALAAGPIWLRAPTTGRVPALRQVQVSDVSVTSNRDFQLLACRGFLIGSTLPSRLVSSPTWGEAVRAGVVWGDSIIAAMRKVHNVA